MTLLAVKNAFCLCACAFTAETIPPIREPPRNVNPANK